MNVLLSTNVSWVDSTLAHADDHHDHRNENSAHATVLNAGT